MNWNLKCRRVERLLALQAGNDLDEAGQLAARRHLVVCPRCRERWQRLQTAQSVLDLLQTSAVKSGAGVVSVWPEVKRQIRILESESAGAQWRNWLPSGALAAACVAVVVLLSSDGVTTDNMAQNPRLPPDAIPIVMPQGSLQPESFGSGSWQEKFAPDDRRPVRYLLDGTDLSRL